MVCSEHIAKGGKDDTSQKEIATDSRERGRFGCIDTLEVRGNKKPRSTNESLNRIRINCFTLFDVDDGHIW